MPKSSNVYSIIVPADTPIFSAHTYYEIYGGNSGCSAVINGTSINVGQESSISVLVRSISGGTGCYLLGDNIDVYTGSISVR